jgi:hypothetical protein
MLFSRRLLTQAPKRLCFGSQEVAQQLLVIVYIELSQNLIHVVHAGTQVARVHGPGVAELLFELLAPS